MISGMTGPTHATKTACGVAVSTRMGSAASLRMPNTVFSTATQGARCSATSTKSCRENTAHSDAMTQNVMASGGLALRKANDVDQRGPSTTKATASSSETATLTLYAPATKRGVR